jgi:acetyl-CoA carboxylase carboxyl transferase subunit alpha
MLSSPRSNRGAARETILPFEQQLCALEAQLAQAATDEERESLEQAVAEERERVYSNLTPWQRVLLARHLSRPRMLDYTTRILDDFIELHGDRAIGDDPAMIGGIARFRDRSLVVVGQQKGASTEERSQRNFGMAHPEGYRKALRLFKLAERLGIPILTLVDTSGAHPGIEAEAHGQGPCIAQNLLEMSRLKVPIMAAVLAEGGSGGALGIAVADWVAMFENAVYNVCAPERCAEILWRDIEQKEVAAGALKASAQDLYELGVVDVILPEPGGGAHRDPDGAAQVLAEEVARFLAQCDANEWSAQRRQEKFRQMGGWEELVLEQLELVEAVSEADLPS